MSKTCILKKLSKPCKITLYKNGNNKNIYYYFSWKKKSYRGSTGADDLQIAEDKVVEIHFDIVKGIREKGKFKNIKFEDLIKKFFKFKEERNISNKTLSEYKRQSKYLIEKFKTSDINSIPKKSVYQEYIDWRKKYYTTHENKRLQIYKKNGKKVEGRVFKSVGPATLNRECRLLVSVLKFGKEYMNILQDTTIHSYKMLPEKRREEILTREEYQKLKEYWMKKNPYYWYIISFVNNTGIRYPQELLKIIYEDVHLDKSFVLIRNRKNKNKSVPVNTPVPLVGRAKEIIEILISRPGISTDPKSFVFVNDNGVQIKSITKQFKKSLVECGIEKNLTMYSLRHLFTTRMVRRPDIPIKILSEVLGHKDTTMINKFYSHLRTEDLVNVFQRSEDHKQEIINNHTDQQPKTTT